MNFPKSLILAAVLATAAATSNAQTYDIGFASCSPGLTYDCYQIPLTAKNQTAASMSLSIYGTTHNLAFHDGLISLGTAVIDLNSIQTISDTVSYSIGGTTQTSILPVSISFMFSGTDDSGRAYTGSGTVDLGYTFVLRCNRCAKGWHHYITGGSVTYQYQ